MATLAATRFNEQMSSYLQALRQRGKCFKVAMVACRMLCILNAIPRRASVRSATQNLKKEL